jgi:gluconate 2-dehydrogenase gamma chain
MDRRTVLKVLTASTLRAANQCGTASDVPAFFTPEEHALLERLMELIIPADAHSPGAKAAKVPAFADLMISTGPDSAKFEWRAGLAAFRAAESLEVALAQAAAEEASPKSELGRFFIELKRMTVNGYYTSTIGIHDEMGYVGNQHLTAAPECDHPEHKGNLA